MSCVKLEIVDKNFPLEMKRLGNKSYCEKIVVNYYPFGKSFRSFTSSNGKHVYSYSGKEKDDYTDYSSYGFRYYNADLARWMNPDPAHQFNSPYVFNGNQPVLYIDKDGKFAWFVPLLLTMAKGAAIGATVSAVTYSAISLSSGNFSWDGFGKALGNGALAGAVSGGVGFGIESAATALGVDMTATFSSMMVDGAQALSTEGAMSAISGRSFDFGDAFIAFGAGSLSGIIPDFAPSAGMGKWESIGRELLQNGVIKGFAQGVTRLSLRAMVGKEVNPEEILYSMAGSTVRTGLNIGLMGYGYDAESKNSDLKRAREKFENQVGKANGGVTYDKFKPIYRRGGLYQLFASRSVTWGRNFAMVDGDIGTSTEFHELIHYYQQIYSGTNRFYGQSIKDQISNYLFGTPIYDSRISFNGTFESEASRYTTNNYIVH